LPATATVESDKLYTLANVLASCVNTDGTTGCPQLFSDTTYGGIPPTDIFGAALAIAQHPDTYVHDLFTLTTPQAPFPASGNEPNEWTMTIAYADPTMHTPRSIAIDQASNVWVLNNADGTLAGFTPQGAPLAGSPYTGDGTFQPSALAVDAGGNIWVTSPLATQDLVGVNRHPAVHPHPHAGSGGQNTVGTVTEFLSNGAQVTGSINFSSADLNAPSSVAVDPFTGFIWIANQNAQLSVLSAVDGSEQVPGAGSGWGTTNSSIGSANTVVLGNAGDAFVVANNLSIGVVGTTTGTLTSFSSSMQSQAPLAVAVDIEGNLWTGSGSAGPTGFLTTLNSAATQVGTDVTGGGLNNPTTLAIDSSDHVWMTNQMGANLSEFGATGAAEGNGTVLSPSGGLGLDAGIALAVGLAIDASGDLWVSDATNNRLVNFVGIAGPVATPLFAAPVAP
jgi:sugar lactone lactonase YvrE